MDRHRGNDFDSDQLVSFDNFIRDEPDQVNLSDMGILNSTDFAHEMRGRGGNALYLAGSLAVALAEVPSYQYGVPTTKLTHFHKYSATSDMTTLRYTNTQYRYGYGVRTTSSHLSMAVMSICCVISVLYPGYSFFTGLTSTAWSSVVELVAHALQSSKPSVLGDSSVGIDSVKTFSQSVGIRVNTDNELELVFADDRDSSMRTLRKTEHNKDTEIVSESRLLCSVSSRMVITNHISPYRL